MATVFPAYPANTLAQAEDLIIFTGNQLSDVINGDALSEVETLDGFIPTIRKTLVDNFNFKSPIAWSVSSNETVFNQLRVFTDGSWWYAPLATTGTPVAMGADPYSDSNWLVFSKNELTVFQNTKRLAAEAGYNLVGTFRFGCTVTTALDVVLNEKEGLYYSCGGTLPKSVDAGSSPTPAGTTVWVDRTDGALRDEVTPSISQLMNRSYIKDGRRVADGTFESGATLTVTSDVLVHKLTGKAYSWGGSYPPGGYVVAHGSLPTDSNWIDNSISNNIAGYIQANILTQDAISACEAFCKIAGLPMIMRGQFTASELLKWNCNTDANGATIITDYGIEYGSQTAAEAKGRIAVLPSCIPATPSSTANVYKPGSGVTIRNIIQSDILVQTVGTENGGWEVGLRVLGDHAGAAWNTIKYLYSHNNRISFKISRNGALGDPLGVGYANQNAIELVHMYKKPHAVGSSPDVESYHIYADNVDSNTFICPAIEQDTFTGRPGATTLAYFINGCSDNQLLRAHTESPEGSLIVFDGSGCQNNTIEPDGASSGYGIVISEINGALYNRVDRGRWGEARLLHRPVCYGHGFDIDRPVREVYDPLNTVQNRDGSTTYNNWSTREFAGRVFLKNSSDTYPRVDINGRGGYIRVGYGSEEPIRQFPVVCQQFSIFANNAYIAPTSPKPLRLLSGLSHVTADFVMSSSDGTLYAAGKMQALVSYSGSGDYSIIMQHCDIAVSTFDASSVNVKLNTYSGANNILQFRAKANKTGSTGSGIDVRVTASAVQHE